MIRLFSIVAIAVLSVACVNTDYVGKTYAPTTSVDVYYSMIDVKRSYEVMGKIKAEAMEGWDSTAMIAELQKQAQARGADAIVVEDVHTEVTGSTTTTSGKHSDKPEYVATAEGKIKKVNSKDSGEYYSTTTTVETRQKVIEAELLKYQ